MSLFVAKTEVDEFEALVLGAPQHVAGLQVGVHVAFAVEEGQSLQHIPGTVLDHPHGVALVGGAHQQIGHVHIQQLQQQAARCHANRTVIGEHPIQGHCGGQPSRQELVFQNLNCNRLSSNMYAQLTLKYHAFKMSKGACCCYVLYAWIAYMNFLSYG